MSQLFLGQLKETGQLSGCKGNPFSSQNMLVFAADENTLSRLAIIFLFKQNFSLSKDG